MQETDADPIQVLQSTSDYSTLAHLLSIVGGEPFRRRLEESLSAQTEERRHIVDGCCTAMESLCRHVEECASRWQDISKKQRTALEGLASSLKVAAGYLLNATSFAVPKDTLPPLDFETLSPLHLSLFAEACAIKWVGDSVVRHPDVADPTDTVIRWMWKPLQSHYDISRMRSTAGMVSRDKPYLPADPANLLMEQKTDIAAWLACFASSQWTSWTRQDDDVGGPDATIWGTLEVVDATEWRDTNELPPPGWWFAESVAISTAEQAEDEDSSDPGTEPDVETGKRPGVFWDPDTDLSD